MEEGYSHAFTHDPAINQKRKRLSIITNNTDNGDNTEKYCVAT